MSSVWQENAQDSESDQKGSDKAEEVSAVEGGYPDTKAQSSQHRA